MALPFTFQLIVVADTHARLITAGAATCTFAVLRQPFRRVGERAVIRSRDRSSRLSAAWLRAQRAPGVTRPSCLRPSIEQCERNHTRRNGRFSRSACTLLKLSCKIASEPALHHAAPPVRRERGSAAPSSVWAAPLGCRSRSSRRRRRGRADCAAQKD